MTQTIIADTQNFQCTAVSSIQDTLNCAWTAAERFGKQLQQATGGTELTGQSDV